MQIGIDTLVILGLLDSQDVWHTPAVNLQRVMAAAGLEPVYFDCTLAEAISAMARRLREKHREVELPALLDRLLADFPAEAITWILPDVPRLYSQVMELIRLSAGELNFNDGLIALACRERSISALASFDRDFDSISWLIRVAVPEDVEAWLAANEKPTPDE
jgi:predicted nucleic acid-binding protein